MNKTRDRNRLFSLFRLTGKTALVTGGMGLLGSQFVKTLALAGARVCVFDLQTKFPPLLSEMVEKGYKISAFKVNIADQASVGDGFVSITNVAAAPSILINNAGMNFLPGSFTGQNSPFESYSEENWDTVNDSHLKGAFLVSREFFRNFSKRAMAEGSIINISSTYGIVAPDQSLYEHERRGGRKYFKPVAYTVAKAGMIGFTKWLAEYGGPLGVRVNALAPGGVNANFDPEFVAQYVKRTILNRMALSTDYNGAILFLASSASSYMTGATLVVDGGWTAR